MTVVAGGFDPLAAARGSDRFLRKGDGLILTSDLTTDGPRSVLLSFGD
jgi:hypothetical protein